MGDRHHTFRDAVEAHDAEPFVLLTDDEAAEMYEASSGFVLDALEAVVGRPPDDLPPSLVAQIAVWYSRTPDYAQVVEDIAMGDRRLP